MTPAPQNASMQRVVQVKKFRHTFTFTAEQDGPLAFWRVRVRGLDWHSPIRALGNEEPDFFRELASAAYQRMMEQRG